MDLGCRGLQSNQTRAAAAAAAKYGRRRPLPQPKLVLDEVSRGGPAARRRGEVEQLGDEVDVADRRHALDRPPQRRLVLHQVLRSSLLSFIYLHQTNGPYRVKQATKETHGEPSQTPKIEHKSLRTQ